MNYQSYDRIVINIIIIKKRVNIFAKKNLFFYGLYRENCSNYGKEKFIMKMKINLTLSVSLVLYY